MSGFSLKGVVNSSVIYGPSFWRLVAPAVASAIGLAAVHQFMPTSPAWYGIAAGVVVAYGLFAIVAAMVSFGEDDLLMADAIRARLAPVDVAPN